MTAITSGLLGVNITETPTTNTFGVALGTCVDGVDGTRFMLVHASGAVAQYDCVGIDENYEAAAITKAIVDDGWAVGFAQVALADNDYGWVALSGSNIQCAVLTGCAADVAMYTSATAGSLDDQSSLNTKVDGVVCVGAHVTGTDNVEIIATYPKSTTF